MRTTSEIPEASFPLHSELLGRTDEPGPLGDVAHLLAAGMVGYVALKPHTTPAILRLCHAPASVTLPLLAGLRPFGRVWVEYALVSGERCGILTGTLPDGSVWARCIRRNASGSARALPIGLRRVGKARNVSSNWDALMEGRWVDNPAAEGRWVQWAQRKLKMELLIPDITAEQGLGLLYSIGVHDLIVLAAATSPRFMPDMAVLVRAARGHH